MHNSAPQKHPSDDQTPSTSPSKRTEAFLGAAVLLQGLSFVCNFLPWSSYVGVNYAGYQAHQFRDHFGIDDGHYDGRAGQINLVVSIVLFLFGVLCVAGRPLPAVLITYRRLMFAWNVGFAFWLVVIFNRLGTYKEVGLVVTLARIIH